MKDLVERNGSTGLLSDDEIYKRVKNRYLALTVLKIVKYQEVIKEIRKQYVYIRLTEVHPRTLTEAYNLLEQHHAAAMKAN